MNFSNNECITPTKKTVLFDGKTFSGWTFVSKDSTHTAWSVVEETIVCKGKPNGYVRTLHNYHDYQLHVEWRYPSESGNSGVFLHLIGADKVWPNCLEVQLLSNKAGDIRCNGGAIVHELTQDSPKAVAHLQSSSEKPSGEWNLCDIECRGNTVKIRVNGVLQNEVTEASANCGKIALQAEGKLIEFRRIYLDPLLPL